jgi:hypothetical protein
MLQTIQTKVITVGFGHLDFEHSKIVWDFDIRISDLTEINTDWTDVKALTPHKGS